MTHETTCERCLSAEQVLLLADDDFLKAAEQRFPGAFDAEARRRSPPNLGSAEARWRFLKALVPQAEGEGELETDDAPERFLLTDDGDFVAAAYARFLGRDVDPSGAAAYGDMLASGVERIEVLRNLSMSEEARHRGSELPSTNAVFAPEVLLLVADEVFLATARHYARRRGVVVDLATPGDGAGLTPERRRALVDAIAERLAPNQGREYWTSDAAPEAFLLRGNAEYVAALFRLFLGREPDLASSEYYVQRLEDGASRAQLVGEIGRSEEAQAFRHAAVEPPTPPSNTSSAASAVAPQPPSADLRGRWLFLLPPAGPCDEAGRAARRFVEAALTVDQPLALVLWNGVARRLETASLHDLLHLRFSDKAVEQLRRQSGVTHQRLRIETTPGEADEWLVLPHLRHFEGAASGLVPLDVIMAAKSLGRRTAGLFRGFEALRAAPNEATDFEEHHAQALLLADLILADSRLARDELVAFFSQHQLSDRSPLLLKVTLPAARHPSSAPEWSRRIREVRAAMRRAVSPLERLGDIYLAENGGLFVERLGGALTELGVTVRRSLPPVSTVGSERPGKSWLLLGPHSRADDLRRARVEADRRGLRLAVVLPPLGAAPSVEFCDALAEADRVVLESEADLQNLEAAMLASRSKLLDAEHRFAVVLPATQGPGRRPERQHGEDGARVRGLLVLCDEGDDIVLKAAQAAKAQNNRLTWSVVHAGATSSRLALEADADPDRFKRWDAASLAASDFVVIGPDDVDGDLHGREATWAGAPVLSLVRGEPRQTLGRVTLSVDDDGGDLQRVAEAMLDFTDDVWRRALAGETTAGLAFTWSEYAQSLMRELSRHRLDQSTRTLSTTDRDIYDTLPRLSRRPQLSVCISTYNRMGWLDLSLSNLFSQIDGRDLDIEVLVVDNASTDDTSAVVARHQHQPLLRYHRNPANVGMLGNLAITASMARGRHVWVLGDDDLPRPGLLDQMLKTLTAHPGLRMIYTNYGYSDEQDPASVADLKSYLNTFNELEPGSPDELSTVAGLAARNENFYTAIYCQVFRRDDALRAYCQDSSGPVFSTMAACIPTTLYVLAALAGEAAFWVGEPSLVVNSNVSWGRYAPLFELEQFPRGWDLAELAGTASADVDRRRSNRLWLTALMWRRFLENDADADGISRFISPVRVMLRMKHLERLSEFIDGMIGDYVDAYARKHPGALVSPSVLFSAFPANLAKVQQERRLSSLALELA